MEKQKVHSRADIWSQPPHLTFPKLADMNNIAFHNKRASWRCFYVNYWTKLHLPR